MHYDVITFDCYGTLIDWESGIAAAFEEAMERDGVRVDRNDILRGYAAIEPQDNDHGAWIAHADRALYAAKAAGRNRCMAADVRRAA